MSLLVLLQDNVNNIRVTPNDIAWRTTDVIYVCAGLVSVLSAWFLMKSAQEKINDRITTEVANGDEKRAAIKREFEIQKEKHMQLEARLKDVENSMDTIEKDLGKKIEAFGKDVQDLKIAIVTTKNEILQALIKRK